MWSEIDFDESGIYHQNPKLLELLLKDQTTGKNICWATENYIDKGHMPQDEIKIEDIVNNHIIRPRVDKDQIVQRERTRERAEVFTPSWLVSDQVNTVIDQKSKGWLQESTWLELACGEAPYTVSRYDVTTGEPIPCKQRVGFMDKKIQTIQNDVNTEDEWFKQVCQFYQQTYAYEFQGDSLLIARENLLLTFNDFYEEKFHQKPSQKWLEKIAEVISYNIIQADGLTGKIPFSDVRTIPQMVQLSLFDDYEEVIEPQEAIFINWKTNEKNKLNNLGEDKMKFDVVIGNPPYQLNDNGKREDGSQNASATALYPYFVEEAEKISDIQSIITPARYLYGAGKGTKSLTEKMLNDNSIQNLTVFNNAALAFGSAASIRG